MKGVVVISDVDFLGVVFASKWFHCMPHLSFTRDLLYEYVNQLFMVHTGDKKEKTMFICIYFE